MKLNNAGSFLGIFMHTGSTLLYSVMKYFHTWLLWCANYHMDSIFYDTADSKSMKYFYRFFTAHYQYIFRYVQEVRREKNKYEVASREVFSILYCHPQRKKQGNRKFIIGICLGFTLSNALIMDQPTMGRIKLILCLNTRLPFHPDHFKVTTTSSVQVFFTILTTENISGLRVDATTLC